MLIRLFSKAGATGHVFFLKNGRSENKGLAYSGFIGPKTTVVVVPTTPQILNFSIEAQTKDKQVVTVNGNLTVTLQPEKAVSKFDFTVNPYSGGYLGDWTKILQAKVIQRVLRAVLGKVKELDVETATRSQVEIETAVTAALGQDVFSSLGITVDSCSIPKIEAFDDDVAEAIGAQERQAMLTEADKALHERRMKASENERGIKQYEAATALQLERDRTELIEKQAENKKKEAETDAEGIRLRLAPLNDMDAGKLLGAALMEGFKSGRVNSVAITSDLLAALQRS